MRRPRLFGGALIALALVLGLAGAGRDAWEAWVSQTRLPPLLSETSVEMRDREGALLRVYTVRGGRWRLGAGVEAVDPLYLRMLIAYEDKRFREHAGVDLWAMARAVTQAACNGRVVSGGSTLSMQVARLLEDSGTGRIEGKLRQMRLAWALERKLSKDQLLALYLTHAPYGGNLEGVRAATLAWFGKEPTRLTPAQAALLVALPQSPEARRPDRDWSAARAARDRVLARVHAAGVITDEAYETALREPVPRARIAFPRLAPHLTDRARAGDPLSVRHDLTLDARLQEQAGTLAREALLGRPGRLSIAMMVADHQSGEILASVGSASYGETSRRQGFVDMTQALRSPGSTLKPLVYAMAFDRGLAHPETVIDDRPVAFGGYAPQNFDGRFRGEIRVSEALQLSLNIPVVMLMDEIGPARFMAQLRRAGARPVLPGGKPGLAVALGGLGLRLEDLLRLYAGLARGGEALDLHWQKGQAAMPKGRIVSRVAAWQVGHILAGLRPPGGKAEGRLAFKTGTSYGHRDAWAVGFDGRHVAAVWMGRADGTPVPGAFGGDLAAPVLLELFQRIAPERTPLAVPPPETLIVENARLPLPLQRFRGRNAAFSAPADAPVMAFPPDGARLAMQPGLPLVVKIREGVPPFTVLADGAPAVTGARTREIALTGIGRGFHRLSVIDARGQSARVDIRLD
ncbi:penicillin-binding protein 1C [Rhodalgimonas zhirmunskyi]|uniref:peptidoglycan glycosyltransferase n=1 Tax=Rhodalgimonas zhirmunskyi TaxID=2964767 RepID=A0AAJ1X6M2_9RHOB|nr:penicillin-binding protein 1C [Rhodoalgimonas zhirmunskyi]MDQ2095646.1 penicillin-binding protein 1C [Rhodoalgimonas zhirmunskyi]